MRMLIVNPIAGCGYALKVMEQVQSVLTARNLPFRVMRYMMTLHFVVRLMIGFIIFVSVRLVFGV